MKSDNMIAARPDRNGGMAAGRLLALTAFAALLLAPVAAQAQASDPSAPVRFESMPGSTVKRVILSAKAAERLGIETGRVDEQQIVRTQMVGGQVTHPLRIQAEQRSSGGSFGGFGKPEPRVAMKSPAEPAAGEAWVRLTLSQEEWDRVAQKKSARILPLATRSGLAREVLALPAEAPPLEDPKRSMLTVYYVVQGEDHGVEVNDRMRVELQLAGSDEKRMVVPYSALYYDGKGEPWVYTATEPLVFERKRVDVEGIVGELAVLNDGPAVGTKVVTTGAALLFGAEVIYKR